MNVIAPLTVVILWLAAIVASLYGYIHNILSLVHHVGAFGLMEVVRVVGLVIPPVGIVMGYVA